MTHHLNIKIIFKVFSLNTVDYSSPDDYSSDIITLKQQQAQDPVLETVNFWFSRNSSLMTLPTFLVFFQRQTQI